MKKKRILSLLLAVITVFQIIPWSMLTIFATGEEETGIDISEMEVGKYYTAKFASDIFWPYARDNFVSDEYLTVTGNMPDGYELTVVRKSLEDLNYLYVKNPWDSWLQSHSQYRYVSARDLSIEGGITFQEMAIGVEYTATISLINDDNFGEETNSIEVYRKGDISEFYYSSYGYITAGHDEYSETSTEDFPQALLVQKLQEDDDFVYVANEDWPWEYEVFRYLEAEYDVIILEEYVPPIHFTCNGIPVEELTLLEGDKLSIYASKPEEAKGELTWSWEILADADQRIWAKIGDKETNTCDVTLALVKNVLDENNETKLRAVASDGEKEYKSLPMPISVKLLPAPVDPFYENLVNTASVEEAGVTPAVLNANGEELLSNPINRLSAPLPAGNGTDVLAADAGSSDEFSIYIRYVKVRPDGQKILHYTDRFSYITTDNYGAFPVTVPSISGYYALELLQGENPAVNANPNVNNAKTEFTIPAGHTTDVIYTVYYYPKQVEYKIVHWLQNIYDDLYGESIVETRRGTVDAPVPELTHYSGDEGATNYDLRFVGFEHLYYEHAEVAADGQTVINIYYDREYFDVFFVLVHSYAYGQEPMLVKYETTIGVNKPVCPGWLFDGWDEVTPRLNPDGSLFIDDQGKYVYDKVAENQCKYSDFTSSYQLVQPTITSTVYFQAKWGQSASSYTVVYWLENPNDGNYSVWDSVKIDSHKDGTPVKSGELVTWTYSDLHDVISKKDDFEYATYNASKTEEGLGKQGVYVEGDGSTKLNIYFSRRFYEVTYKAATPSTGCGLDTHTHGDGTCEYNPFYCMHTHSDRCKTENCSLEEHTHVAGCKACSKTEHIHTPACCTVHVHKMECFSFADNLNEVLTEQLTAAVKADITATCKKIPIIGWLIGDFIGGIIGTLSDETITKSVNGAAGELVTKAPPQNLQTGYVYILEDQEIKYNYEFFETREGVTEYTIRAIYIDNFDDDPYNDWYYYGGTKASESIEIADACDKPFHDHTGGCNSEKCTVGYEHVHSDTNGCYGGCGKTEHKHSAYCACTHEHNEDCYGYLCMKPEHTHNGDGSTEESGYQVVRVLQAKYGQDITAYLPYYLELYADNLHKNAAGQNFTAWKYASTGTDQTAAKTHYVKHVTMEKELCYSNGNTAIAQYDAAATNAYVLYYLFESFDQTSIAEDYAIDGTARKQLNGKWYDSDPVHLQLIMFNNANLEDGLIPGGNKTIEGVTFVETSGNPATGTLNFEIGSIQSETLFAYFYDRNLIETTVLFNHTGGEKLLTIPKAGETTPVKYGVPMKAFAEALKSSALYDNFDVNNVPYPENLEAEAYRFDGWYFSPYATDDTRVDWETDVVPNGKLKLYAIWVPVTHTVKVYEDSTRTEEVQYALDNKGYQEVNHRSYAYAPTLALTEHYDQSKYQFAGWYYIDSKTGEEKGFNFGFPITDDMEIYAKWRSSVSVSYRIHYVTPVLDEEGKEVKDADGNTVYVNVADSLERTDIAGQSRTFFALAGNELYEGYRTMYFPEVGSHTILMEEDSAKNEYTFVYQRRPFLFYTVEYVDELTGAALKDPITIKTDDAAVVEKYLPIEGYSVDKYAKSLILAVPKEGEENPNVITFYYTKLEQDEEPTYPWHVYHYIQNLDGTYSRRDSFEGEAELDSDPYYFIYEVNEDGEPVAVPVGVPLDYSALGYTFVASKTDVKTRKDGATADSEPVDVIATPVSQTVNGTTQYGYPINKYGIEINLYYDRAPVGYSIVYRDVDNPGEALKVDKKPNGTGGTPCIEVIEAKDSKYRFGDKATAHLNDVWNVDLMVQGYQLEDPSNTRELVLHANALENVIVFYYRKAKAEFFYEIVCDDPNSGVSLSRERENPIEVDAPDNTLVGSVPIESSTYYFAGWFKDKDCTQPVTDSDPVTIVDNKLTPTKTSFTYEGESGELYFGGITYYAKFLPRSASLTVTVNSGEGDSFILTFTGKEGTFAEGKIFTVAVQDGQTLTVTDVAIGSYDVILDTAWSWRYDALANVSVEVVASVGGSITITPEVADGKNQWITSDANGIVETQ